MDGVGAAVGFCRSEVDQANRWNIYGRRWRGSPGDSDARLRNLLPVPPISK